MFLITIVLFSIIGDKFQTNVTNTNENIINSSSHVFRSVKMLLISYINIFSAFEVSYVILRRPHFIIL